VLGESDHKDDQPGPLDLLTQYSLAVTTQCSGQSLSISIGSRFEDAASAIQRVWPATSAAHQALAKDIGIHGAFGATIGHSLNQLLQHLQVVRVSQYSSQEPNQNAYNLINLQIIPDRQSYCQYLP
jgi:hypothetical protein